MSNSGQALVNSLKIDHPDAASSLREGLDETITILEMNILLPQSLRSTNAIESGFSVAAKNMKNIKNWKNGTMVQRWASAAMLDLNAGFMSVLSAEIKRLIKVAETG